MKKVLIFCAHPDDDAIALGGTIRGLADEGAKITEVVFATGNEGYSQIKEKDKIIETRAKEREAAGRILGIGGYETFNYADYDIPAKEMSVWNDYRNIKEFLCVTVPEEIEYPLAIFSSLGDILRETMGAGKKLGIVGYRDIPRIIYERITKACPEIEIIPADEIIENMRLIKSEKEILCLKEAGRLACIAYEKLMKNAVPGQTELYATGEAEGAARSAGAESIIFTVFGSGKRADTIIGRPTEKIIEDGDMIMASIAVQYEGYVATAEFPFVAGKSSDKQKFLIGTLIEAANAGLPHLKAGKPAKEFVQAVRDVFRKRDLSKYDIYPPLHGCGCAEAESPYPDEKTEMTFQTGMTVNTDISLFGHPAGSNRIEEGFVITDEGFETLTPLIRHLCEKYIL